MRLSGEGDFRISFVFATNNHVYIPVLVAYFCSLGITHRSK